MCVFIESSFGSSIGFFISWSAVLSCCPPDWMHEVVAHSWSRDEGGRYLDRSDQPHLVQDHSLRTALILNGVNESKICFTFQLGANYLLLLRLTFKLKCVEMFCWANISHRGVKSVWYQGLPIIGVSNDRSVVCSDNISLKSQCWSIIYEWALIF